MQFLDLTIYLRGRWFSRRLGRRAGDTQRDALVASDVAACLLALDPKANPAPQVLRVEFSQSYPTYAYDNIHRPHFEDYMDSCRVSVLLPTACDLLGFEERLRPHLTERFLHISERWLVAAELAQWAVLKVGDAWLHSPAQAERLTGVALPVRSWFGPNQQRLD